MNLAIAAHDWLIRREKRPKRTDDGRWRWVLPDPPTADGMSELPKAVFDMLPGDDPRFPWLYATAARAMEAAELAVFAAMVRGWRPVHSEVPPDARP